jgi:uncharacterized caspase-like protein
LPSGPELRIASPVPGAPILRRSFELEVIADDAYGIEEFMVMQDGKELPAEKIATWVTKERRDRRARLACELRLPQDDDETEVRVRVRNRRGVLSRWQTAHVRFEAPSRELFVLGLGVADYDDDSMDLQYPVKDVEDIVAALQQQEGRFYDRVNVRRLADREVSLPMVRRLRDKFLLQASEEDTIIVFVAGHGVRTETNEYWFLTSDATPTDPYFGIDRGSLEQLVTWPKLHAKRRILLIDTCHSGGALGMRSGVRGVNLFEQEDVDRVREELGEGVYILAASSDDEFAREQQGNGIFTRALLEGLGGAADVDRDGFVRIEELKEFAARTVLDLSGGLQKPTFPLVDVGENFALARVVDDE